jgi:hypothetical protein
MNENCPAGCQAVGRNTEGCSAGLGAMVSQNELRDNQTERFGRISKFMSTSSGPCVVGNGPMTVKPHFSKYSGLHVTRMT